MNIQTALSLGLAALLLCASRTGSCFAGTARATPPIQFSSASNLETVDESIGRLSKLIKQTPHDGLLYLSRAEYLNLAGRYEEALRDANQAIELSHGSAPAYKQRLLAFISLAKWREALLDADQYVKMTSGFEQSVAYETRGWLELRADTFSQAIVDFDSAIQLDHDSAWLHLYRAIAFSGFGVHERAIKDCTKCLQLIEQPRDSSDCRCAFFALGVRAHAYDQLGRHELAQKDLKLQSQILKQLEN